MSASLDAVSSVLTNTLQAGNPEDPSLSCDDAINTLILRLPAAGSIFYAITNGWYLGQWADYTSCLTDATNSHYILAEVTGDYASDIEFVRGGAGKFTTNSPNQTTRMGLCFPKQCSKEDVEEKMSGLIKGYSKNAGWENVEVTFTASTIESDNIKEASSNGLYALLAVLGVVLLLAAVGTLIEVSTIGDLDEYKKGDEDGDKAAEKLAEAALFRRVTQYDCVLLQRKKQWARKLLAFSFIRNGVLMNILPRGQRTAIQNEMKCAEVPIDMKVADNLGVFNGLKGSAILLAGWGMTFYFSWFSVLT